MTTAPSPLIVARSLVSEAPRAALWSVLTEPHHLRQWMAVVPVFADERPLQAGSLVEWRDAAGQPYLSGRITAFEPQRRWVMTLHDRSWPRRPKAGEVTYGFTLSETADGMRIDFRLGDLAIDPQGQDWHDSYVHSQELERIAQLAQAVASGHTAHAEVLALVRAWEQAIQRGDMPGILARHADDIVMFDVPEPLQSLGIDAYRATWVLFFRYGAPSPDLFVIEDLRISAGPDIAFASGLVRIGGSVEPMCRLTLGLEKRAGRWLIVHEHHSAPHPLDQRERAS